MRIKHYKEIAEQVGSNAVEVAINLRKWAGEPITEKKVTAPIMVQAYIASDLKTRIALPDIDFGYLCCHNCGKQFGSNDIVDDVQFIYGNWSEHHDCEYPEGY